MLYGNQVEDSYAGNKPKELSQSYRDEVSKRGKKVKVSCETIKGVRISGDLFIPSGTRTSDHINTLDRLILTDVCVDGIMKGIPYIIIISNCQYIKIDE